MPCNFPFKLYVKSVQKTFTVPCGKCAGCMIDKKYNWSDRITDELSQHPPNSNFFLTLTYDEEHLHRTTCYFNTYDFSDVRQMIISLTNKVGKFPRYYIVPEYGDKNLRSHFHCILFGSNSDYVKEICKYWSERYGLVRIGDKHNVCNLPIPIYAKNGSFSAASSYISGYLCKGKTQFDYDKRIDSRFMAKPRVYCSQHFGMNYPKSEAAISFHWCCDVVRKDWTLSQFVENVVSRSFYHGHKMPLAWSNFIYKKAPTLRDKNGKLVYESSFQKIPFKFFPLSIKLHDALCIGADFLRDEQSQNDKEFFLDEIVQSSKKVCEKKRESLDEYSRSLVKRSLLSSD